MLEIVYDYDNKGGENSQVIYKIKSVKNFPIKQVVEGSKDCPSYKFH